MDELQDCNSQFIRRLVEALRLVIHTARKILNRLYAKCLYNKEFIVLEKCGVMSIGQTHLSKGNFPINLDNILSIVQFPFWNKHDHSEQCSSKFPDFVLGRHNNYNLQSHILSRRVFWVFSLLLFSFFLHLSSKQKWVHQNCTANKVRNKQGKSVMLDFSFTNCSDLCQLTVVTSRRTMYIS